MVITPFVIHGGKVCYLLLPWEEGWAGSRSPPAECDGVGGVEAARGDCGAFRDGDDCAHAVSVDAAAAGVAGGDHDCAYASEASHSWRTMLPPHQEPLPGTGRDNAEWSSTVLTPWQRIYCGAGGGSIAPDKKPVPTDKNGQV